MTYFLLRVCVWLPICFAAWYYLSILWLIPIADTVQFLTAILLPSVVESVHQDGTNIVITTHLLGNVSDRIVDAQGEILVSLHPMKYGFGMPLYSALVFSSTDNDWARAVKWTIGIFFLCTVVLIGVLAELLKVVALDLGDQTELQVGFSADERHAVALWFQFSYLILPMVSPVLIWLVQFREFWKSNIVGGEFPPST